jgi:hypothetical protein
MQSLWGHVWDVVEACFGSVWDRFGLTLGLLIKGHVWGHFATCLGHVEGHVGTCLGHVWDLVGHIWP